MASEAVKAVISSKEPPPTCILTFNHRHAREVTQEKGADFFPSLSRTRGRFRPTKPRPHLLPGPSRPPPRHAPLASQSAQYLLSSSRRSLARMAWCCSFCFCAFSRHERVAMAKKGTGWGGERRRGRERTRGGLGGGGAGRRAPKYPSGRRTRKGLRRWGKRSLHCPRKNSSQSWWSGSNPNASSSSRHAHTERSARRLHQSAAAGKPGKPRREGGGARAATSSTGTTPGDRRRLLSTPASSNSFSSISLSK